MVAEFLLGFVAIDQTVEVLRKLSPRVNDLNDLRLARILVADDPIKKVRRGLLDVARNDRTKRVGLIEAPLIDTFVAVPHVTANGPKACVEAPKIDASQVSRVPKARKARDDR